MMSVPAIALHKLYRAITCLFVHDVSNVTDSKSQKTLKQWKKYSVLHFCLYLWQLYDFKNENKSKWATASAIHQSQE